jgi:hypothetical protein
MTKTNLLGDPTVSEQPAFTVVTTGPAESPHDPQSPAQPEAASTAPSESADAGSIFDDLASLRKASNVTVKKRTQLPPVRVIEKPKGFYFRTHPDEKGEMTLFCSLVVDKSEDGSGTGALYFIAPQMRSHHLLAARLRYYILTPIITKSKVIMLWPVPVPLLGQKDYPAWRSCRDAAEKAKTEWVSLVWNEEIRDNQIDFAEGTIPEPKWPERTLTEWLKEAFADRIVINEEHEFMRRLRGLTD